MGYFLKGYLILCSSPVFSIAIYLTVVSLFYRTDASQTSYIWSQISVIGIQLCGIILCLSGYSKKEPVQSYMLLNIFLIVWGSLGVWFLSFSYSEFIRKSHWPGMESPSMLDYLLYAVGALIEAIWIVSGLVFTVLSLSKKLKNSEQKTKSYFIVKNFDEKLLRTL